MLAIIVIICGFVLGVGIVFAEINRNVVEKNTAKLLAEMERLNIIEAEDRKRREKEILEKNYNPEV